MVRVASEGVLVDAQEGGGLSSWKICHWAVLPKLKPRWNLHLRDDENWLMESLKLFHLYLN